MIHWPVLLLLSLSVHRLVAADEQDEFYLCLHNCALCVRQWEAGVYDGEKCATKCTSMRSQPRVVDPDCTSLKMFNYKVMARAAKQGSKADSQE